MILNSDAKTMFYCDGFSNVRLKGWKLLLLDSEVQDTDVNRINNGNVIGKAKFDLAFNAERLQFFIEKPIEIPIIADRICYPRSAILQRDKSKILISVGEYGAELNICYTKLERNSTIHIVTFNITV